MAENNKDIQSMMDTLDKTKRSLYSDIYYDTDTTNREIRMLRNNLDASLQKISNVNLSNTGLANISQLYTKTLSSNQRRNQDLIDSINSTLGNATNMDRVMGVYMENTWIRDIDRDIDMVCKYLPKLEQALAIQREHVFAADSFSANPAIIQLKNNPDDEAGDENIQHMIRVHNLYEKMDQWYDEIDKRGEVFVYCVPFNKAIKALLDAKSKSVLGGVELGAMNEDTLFDSPEDKFSIQEACGEFIDDLSDPKRHKSNQSDTSIMESVGNIDVSIDTSRILSSALKDQYKAMKFFSENGSSLFFNEADNSIVAGADTNNFSKFSGDPNSISSGGLSLDGTFVAGNNRGENNVNIPGCIIKKLDHAMIKPLYINDICLGYIYIECDKKMVMEQTTFSSTIGGIRPGNANRTNFDLQGSQGKDATILKKIAATISEKVTSKFVNANQDLAKEIYHILEYNANIDASGKVSKINITFLPPEDVQHMYFKFNYETKRGISSLERSLFPAKLFSCMYITNVLQILTRGDDKRVYYVKQTVDTNIAGVLGSVINQIQRGNFGIRQIESMNNVLNMVGKFNDYIIPRGQGGDAPVDFEVLPGQQVDVKTELMNMLEEMAIDNTGTPIEVITMRQQADYATHLTMTNTKFLQFINNRQAVVKTLFNKILTRIYNYEFNIDNSRFDDIELLLPPPVYLNAMNSSQILDSVNAMGEAIAKLEYSDDESDKQMEFSRFLKRNLSQHVLPKDIISKSKDEAEMSLAKRKGDEE